MAAAVAHARLLRALGGWREAADCLRRFAHDYAEADPSPLVPILLQLGRLRAGPLEDVEGAVEVYQEALDLDADCLPARQALAELLVHRPDRWDDAVDHHRAILAASPARGESLRGLIQVARGRNDARTVADGLAILRAIGVISPAESGDAPAAIATRLESERNLGDPLWETARRLTRAAADAIAVAHPVPDPPASSAGQEDAVARFRARLLDAEGGLIGPALVQLPDEAGAVVLRVLAALVLEPDAAVPDDETSRALEAALGKWARRRLRRLLDGVSAEDIRAMDYSRWRAGIRAQAADQVLNESRGDLRSALLALIGLDAEDGAPDPPDDADLSSWIAASPQARELLARVESAWVQRL